MTKMPKPNDWSAAYDCVYDAWNRLVQVKDGNTVVAAYEYNGLNQRIKKTVGTIVTESFYNYQWQELETKTLNVTSTCVWGFRYIDDLVCRDRGSERLYVLQDTNWNVVAITDANGVVKERIAYDAFGKPNWLSASYGGKTTSGYGWNRTFTGQEYDSETGLMLYRNRAYHPGLGRFMTRDPIGYGSGSLNLFTYVANKSTRYTDCFGLQQDWFVRPWRHDRDIFSSEWLSEHYPWVDLDPEIYYVYGNNIWDRKEYWRQLSELISRQVCASISEIYGTEDTWIEPSFPWWWTPGSPNTPDKLLYPTIPDNLPDLQLKGNCAPRQPSLFDLLNDFGIKERPSSEQEKILNRIQFVREPIPYACEKLTESLIRELQKLDRVYDLTGPGGIETPDAFKGYHWLRLLEIFGGKFGPGFLYKDNGKYGGGLDWHSEF